MTKFYHAENANRGLIGGARFTIYAMGAGTSWGVYATDSEAEQGAIDGLVGQSGITSIDENEYELCLKKKPRQQDGISTPSSQPPLNGALSLKGSGAAVVGGQGDEPESLIIESRVQSVDEALEVGEAEQEALTPLAAPNKRAKGKRENQ